MLDASLLILPREINLWDGVSSRSRDLSSNVNISTSSLRHHDDLYSNHVNKVIVSTQCHIW